MRLTFVSAGLMMTFAVGTIASQSADGPVLRARHATSRLSVKMMNPAGPVRLVGWDNDSIVVRGHVARGEQFYLYGNDSSMKLGFDDHIDGRRNAPCDVVIYLPKGSKVAVKTVTVDIAASDVPGWFYSVSGGIRIDGSATTIEVQSMSGNVDVNVVTPWVHARTGDGNMLIRGE